MTKLASILAAIFCAFGAVQAQAANVTIAAMLYSTEYMVPYIVYDGPTEPGDIAKIEAILNEHVHCRLECAPDDGSPIAVVSLNGPGGDYYEGLEMAQFFRANAVATVVESGSYCYSACAFAFLGGTGYSPQSGIGSYIDRVAEPGSVIGFHAPYLTEEALMSYLEDHGADVVMDNNRTNYARMVEELVQWNIDPNIVGWMVFQGPDETYDLTTANDLFLTRSALPATPASVWISDKENAIRNVCLRLMSELYQSDPNYENAYMATEFTPNTGISTSGEALSGYVISDELLRVGHCSITQESLSAGYDWEVALYMTAGISGQSAPMLSFFNRENGWSTMGIGADPTRRVFQKGSLNHFFLNPSDALENTSENAMAAINASKFEYAVPVAMPSAPAQLTLEAQDANTLIARSGDVRAFYHVGDDTLYDAFLAQDFAAGKQLTNDSVSEFGFVKSGTYANSGHPFSWIGFKLDGKSLVVRIENLGAEGDGWSAEESALVRALECSVAFEGLQLKC